MKKSTIATAGGVGIIGLAMLAAMAQAHSTRHVDYNDTVLDMQNAARAASEAVTGNIIEAELEMGDKHPVWEVNVVNDSNQVITVEIDGRNGQIVSTEFDDDIARNPANTVSLTDAINTIRDVDDVTMIEAELDSDGNQLIWKIETSDTIGQEKTYQIHALTGEILQ